MWKRWKNICIWENEMWNQTLRKKMYTSRNYLAFIYYTFNLRVSSQDSNADVKYKTIFKK